jgi:hypothetical protein
MKLFVYFTFILSVISITNSSYLSNWEIQVGDNPANIFDSGFLEIRFTPGTKWQNALISLNRGIFSVNDYQNVVGVIQNIEDKVRYNMNGSVFTALFYGDDIVTLIDKIQDYQSITYKMKINYKRGVEEKEDIYFTFTIVEKIKVYDEILMEILNHNDSSSNLKFLDN